MFKIVAQLKNGKLVNFHFQGLQTFKQANNQANNQANKTGSEVNIRDLKGIFFQFLRNI